MIYPRDEHVIGPEPPLGSEHNCCQQVENAPTRNVVAVSVRARAVTVTSCGRICLGGRKINLSHAFAGQAIGIKEVAEKIRLVTFMHYDLGFFDHETRRVECAPNPFEAQVLPMSAE
jgi:putative transposase